MTKKKVLLFGSTGGLGTEIKKKLCKKYKVLCTNKAKINFNKKNSSTKIFKLLKNANPDIIINCSGILGNNKMTYERVFNINLGSNWDIIRFYINNKNKINKKILIILIGSTAYKSGKKNYLLYSASKSALHNLYEGSKLIMKNSKIKILIYHPERMKTKMVQNIKYIKKKIGSSPILVAEKICNLI